ncbi:3-dehydroquinate synthase [Myroides injenensis]|uniref:3-dehydroquinate synthase n=1 Tax=Myroides injenensis TaxID=1183151 RepID=UPI00028A0143|nr:3-dehydroquinate synthase [Myroides injenensis]
MEILNTKGSQILFGQDAYIALGQKLNEKQYSKLFIITDSNCNELCIPYFLSNLPTEIPFEIIEIEAGEEYKTLQTAEGVIQAMLDLGGDRKSVIVTVGGGVVTDLGGFVASIFMRGIDCYNVPTTLLAMVDASVGGKTGVDSAGIKNCIGTFSMPKIVVIDVNYLETLPVNQLKSGYAEMLKHGLIFDKKYFDHLKDIANVDFADIETLVMHSVIIKNEVVDNDPKEKGLRKILNFGHTVGHAIESYFLLSDKKEAILHGEAIAAGMVIEAYLSKELLGLSTKDYNEVKACVFNIYDRLDFDQSDISDILEWLKFDKKNENGVIKCVLLKEIGEATYDIVIDKVLIAKAFEEYLK